MSAIIDLDFFDKLRTVRDRYKKKYDDAINIRDNAKRDLRENVKLNSPRWKDLEKRIPAEFQDAINSAKEEAKNTLINAAADANIKAEARVKAGFRSTKFSELADILRRLDGVNITDSEMQILVNEFGSKNYWSDRLLEKFGNDRGFYNLSLAPDIKTQESVIEKALDSAEGFLNDYGTGKHEFAAFSALHDKTIQKLESEFSNGYSGITLDLDRKVDLLVSRIYSCGGINEKVEAISNTLKTIDDPAVINATLDRLAADGKLDITTLKLSRLDKVLDDRKDSRKNIQRNFKELFDSREISTKDAADRALKRLLESPTDKERSEVLSAAIGACGGVENDDKRNTFIDAVLNDGRVSDNTLKAAGVYEIFETRRQERREQEQEVNRDDMLADVSKAYVNASDAFADAQEAFDTAFGNGYNIG